MKFLQNHRYIKAIVEAGSIRGATENLAISPSALQRQIQNLEYDLGITIFDRLSTGIRLSPEGEVFYDFALRQIDDFDRMKRHLDQLKGGTQGKLEIAISPDISLPHYFKLIRQFQSDFRNIDLNIMILNDNEIYSKLLSGQLDLALMMNPTLRDGLKHLHAKDIKLSAFVPNGIPLMQKGDIRLYALQNFHIALPPTLSFTTTRILAAGERHKINITPCYQGPYLMDFLSHTRLAVIGIAPFPFYRLDQGYNLNEKDFDGKDEVMHTLTGYKHLYIDPKDSGKCTLSLITQDQRGLSKACYKFQEMFSTIFENYEIAS